MNSTERLKQLVNAEGPLLTVLAGCNGAGKTTFFNAVLRDAGVPLVDPDEIAHSLPNRPMADSYHAARLVAAVRRDLMTRSGHSAVEAEGYADRKADTSPSLRLAQTARRRAPQVDPYHAARLADAVRRDMLGRGESFCMETVLADAKGEKLQFLREAQAASYQIVLLWFKLESVVLSMARVQQRVAAGGSDVPDEKLLARFERTQDNATAALQFVDLGIVIDNSSADRPFRPVETWVSGKRR